MRKAITALTTAAATLAAGLSFAAPAQAAEYTGGCPARNSSQMLAEFGDYNDYFEVSNGGFSQFTYGWQGSYGISSENEPWYVNPASYRNSLALANGSWAQTPDFCVGAGEDTFRFFYRGTGQYGSYLNVRATIKADTGTYVYNYRLDGSSSSWKLTPTLGIPNYSASGVQTVSLKFTAASSYYTSRPMLVDDVLVDPWRARGL